MFSRLIVALFALFAFSVFSSPIPCHDTPTPSPTPPPTPTPTDGYSDPTPSSPPPDQTPTTTPAAPPPADTSAPANNASNGSFSGGIATYFYQNGNPGACGWYSSDNDLVCAMDAARYDASLCGKHVLITNAATGQTVTVKIADDCPTCDNANSIDLSVAAFNALSNNNLGLGVLDITWQYLNY